MEYPDHTTVERQRRILRIVLFVIILGTLPFYCAGFLLLGTPRAPRTQSTPPSLTPIDNVRATLTPFPTLGVMATATQLSPLRPTPLQYNPIPVVPTSPIIILPPTQIFIPTNTLAPTLTPFPTQAPPSSTPSPTLTPLPTDPPPTAEPPTAEPPTAEPPPSEELPPAEPPPGS